MRKQLATLVAAVLVVATLGVFTSVDSNAAEDCPLEPMGYACGSMYTRFCPNLQKWIVNCIADDSPYVCIDEGYCGG